MTATDKDGGTSTAVTKEIGVQGIEVVGNVCGTGQQLLVFGTNGADTIKIQAGSSSGTVKAIINGVAQPQKSVAQVVVYGLGGNDNISVDNSLTLVRLLYGGDGNDVLGGGNGPGIQVGGAGNDTLSTGNARDILIGGTGADSLKGGNGDDLLVAGSTAYDDPTTTGEQALCAISKEWNSGSSYTMRIGHLTGTLSGGLNGSTKLIGSGPNRTVFDDAIKDTLTGGLGSDWFLMNRTGGGVLDASDNTGSEVVTDI
jgi:Ca2+-binding RTX toxin-like protein